MKATDFCMQQAILQQKMDQLTAPIISKQLIADQMLAPIQSFQTWTNQFTEVPQYLRNMHQLTIPTISKQLVVDQMLAPVQSFQTLANQFTEVPQYLRDTQFDRIAQIRQNLTFTSTALPSSIAKCIDSYMRLTDTPLTKAALQNQRTSFSSTIQYAAAAVAAAQPYIPVDQIEICPLETLSDLKSRETIWSKDCILALIGVLLTIISMIISSLPDKQLALLIEQNETLIEQHEEIIKIQEENSELHEVLYALTNSINLLTDEVESLRNESEDFDDTSEANFQSEAENR